MAEIFAPEFTGESGAGGRLESGVFGGETILFGTAIRSAIQLEEGDPLKGVFFSLGEAKKPEDEDAKRCAVTEFFFKSQ